MGRNALSCATGNGGGAGADTPEEMADGAVDRLADDGVASDCVVTDCGVTDCDASDCTALDVWLEAVPLDVAGSVVAP